jgi:hypothetical protein
MHPTSAYPTSAYSDLNMKARAPGVGASSGLNAGQRIPNFALMIKASKQNSLNARRLSSIHAQESRNLWL